MATLDRARDAVLVLRVGHEGQDFVIRASGELDIASANMLEDELRRAMESDASTVVLNLEGLTFIDSTGLRTLVRANHLSHSGSRRLRIVHASKEFQRLVEVSGVADVLPLED